MPPMKNGLVPPPPPYIPNFQFATPGALMPQQSPPVTLAPPMQPQLAPTPSVPLPEVPNTASMISAPSAEDLSSLRNYANMSNRFAQFKMGQLQDNPQPFPTVDRMPQTNFDQFLQQQLQERILQSLDAQNGPGERFGKGFDVGQQLAASVVIPAMGSFGSGNNAIGTLQASQMMQENVRARQAQRSASKQALNNSLVNLASLYENVSPQSAKNIAALLKTNMERQKLNMDYQNKGADDVMSALKSGGDSLAKLVEIQGAANQRKANAANNDFDNQLNVAKETNSQQNQQFNQRKDMMSASNEATRTSLAGDALDLQKGKAAEDKRQFDARQGLAEKTLQTNAANQLLTRMQGPMALSAKAGQFGGPAYPGIMDNYRQNDAAMQALQQLGATAGIQGQPFPPAQAPVAPQAAPQSFDFGKWLFGGSQPAIKVNDVVANPSQFIQFDQKQSQALAGARKNPAQTAAVLAPAIQAQLAQRGISATPQQVVQILNNLVR